MSLVQTLIGNRLGNTTREVGLAHARREAHLSTLRSDWKMAHTDTPSRRAMRTLLAGAGLADAVVMLSFLKIDGSVRNMVCSPCPGSDATARYVTVVDHELSHEAERTVYRRVDLDTVIRCQIDFKVRAA